MSGTVQIVSLYIGVSALLIAVSATAMRRRDARGAWYVALTCLGGAQWSLMEGLLLPPTALEVRILLSQIQYAGVAIMVPMTLLFVVSVYEPAVKITATRAALILLPGIALFFLAWTNSFHHLVWTDIRLEPWGAFTGIGYDYGPAFLVFAAYNYALIVALGIVLVRRIMDGSRMIRRQASGVLIAVLFAWVINIVYLVGALPFSGFDPTPISFAVLAAVLAFNFARNALLDLLPAAKDRIFESLADAVIVYDRTGRVVEINTAAEHLLQTRRADAIAKPFSELLRNAVEVQEDRIETEHREVTIPHPHGGGNRVYDARFTTMLDIRGRSIGGAVVFRDITQRKRLERRLNHLASTDPLTGARNRRHFMEVARTEFARARRHNRHVVILMIDIDHFKRINDDFGHEAGDLVLTEVVHRCEDGLRAGDVLGRIGGEEFAAVLPDTNLQQAGHVAERIRNRIENMSVEYNERAIAITISIGMAELQLEDPNVQGLINRADVALYQAKAAGRNRVRS